MKASELRIGNYVTSKMSGILKVQYIPVDIDMSRYEPIPLTEELLLKCPDIKKGVDNVLYLKTKYCTISIFPEIGHILVSNGIYAQSIRLTNDCFLLHQFQNIIHALTNNELNIEL